MKKIILASSSPRRREILKNAGLKFKVDAGDYEEDLSLKLRPHELAKFLSREKAKAVAARHKDALIIAADTFILYKSKILGKPHTKAEAKKMLMMLNNKTHSVITGFTIIDTATGKIISKPVETKVTFNKLTGKEIGSYVETGEPLDKAGAYAIQGLGALLVKKIEGDYLNVIGMPLSALAGCLKKFGVRLP
ncbi:MAG: septum formation inhibitor Maf [Nitrospirae bacterium]|nr:septum formation inhibitor Maf [Nitrospirota bacterium]